MSRYKELEDAGWIYNPESRCYLKYNEHWELVGAVDRTAINKMSETFWKRWKGVFCGSSNRRA